MKWLNENKWFALAVLTLASALVYFRYDLEPSVNVRGVYVLDRITGDVRFDSALELVGREKTK